jgi:hypothetical protein
VGARVGVGQHCTLPFVAAEHLEIEHAHQSVASRSKNHASQIIPLVADGCGQQLHCDSHHGPWSFVLSLTDWEGRKFSGGETMVLSDLTLNFWSHFSADTVIEKDQLMTTIEPHFNQLTLFDPRMPHGVQTVRGVNEPTEARIVLHGWFMEPGARAHSSCMAHCGGSIVSSAVARVGGGDCTWQVHNVLCLLGSTS